MGVIPTFQRTYLPTNSNLDTGQAQLAQDISDAGHAADNLGLTLYDQRVKADNATAFNNADIAFQKHASDTLPGFQKDNALTSDPQATRDQWDQQMQQKQAELASGLPTPAAQRAFMQSSSRFMLQSGDGVRSWADKQQVNNFATTTDNSAQTLYDLANRTPTQENLENLSQKVDQTVIAGSTFMGQDKLDDMKKTMKSNLARSAVEGLISSDNPTQAKTWLKSGQLDPYLEAGEIQKLTTSSVAAERAVAARDRATQAKATSDAMVSVQSVQDKLAQGLPVDPDELSSTANQVAASGNPKLIRNFSNTQQTITFGQQMRASSPADIQATVDKLRASASATQPDFSPDDRDTAIRTIMAEEADPKAQRGVAETILNRFASGKYGNSLSAVVTAPGQFEPHMTLAGRAKMASFDPKSPAYQQAAAAFDNAATSPDTDIAVGASQFISPTAQTALGRQIPAWAQGSPLAEAGKTQFFGDPSAPPRPAYNVSGGISDLNLLKLKVAEGVQAEMKKGMQADPISTIGKLGALQVQPVTFTPTPDGDATPIIQSLQNRAKLYAAGQAVYGPQVNKVFTQDETSELKASLANMNPQQKLAFGRNIYAGLGQAAPAAMQQLAPDEPVFTHAAGLAAYNPNTALEILQGQQIGAKNPLYQTGKDESLEKTNSMFADTAGSAFQAMPDYAANVKRAADAIYIKGMSDKGAALDTPDPKLYTQAVNKALGADPRNLDNTGVVTIGGAWGDGRMKQNIILPPGVTKDTFEGYLGDLDHDPRDFMAASYNGVLPSDVNGKKVPMADVLAKGQMIQVGNGAYKVRMPDGNFLRGGGPSGEYILRADPSTISRTFGQPKLRATPGAKPGVDGRGSLGVLG